MNEFTLFDGKVCSRCGFWKHFGNFYQNKSKKDGFGTWCRQCYSQYHLEPKQSRREKMCPTELGQICINCSQWKPHEEFKYRKQTDNRCRDCFLQWKRDYRASNRQKLLRQRKQRRLIRGEESKEVDRQYRARNIERIRQIDNNWKRAHPEVVAVSARRRRAKKKTAGGSHTVKQWLDLCVQFGGKCLACGRNDVKLTFDHVVPLHKGGSDDIENGQPLCGPCNSRKSAKIIDYRPKEGDSNLSGLHESRTSGSG